MDVAWGVFVGVSVEDASGVGVLVAVGLIVGVSVGVSVGLAVVALMAVVLTVVAVGTMLSVGTTSGEPSVFVGMKGTVGVLVGVAPHPAIRDATIKNKPVVCSLCNNMTSAQGCNSLSLTINRLSHNFPVQMISTCSLRTEQRLNSIDQAVGNVGFGDIPIGAIVHPITNRRRICFC